MHQSSSAVHRSTSWSGGLHLRDLCSHATDPRRIPGRGVGVGGVPCRGPRRAAPGRLVARRPSIATHPSMGDTHPQPAIRGSEDRCSTLVASRRSRRHASRRNADQRVRRQLRPCAWLRCRNRTQLRSTDARVAQTVDADAHALSRSSAEDGPLKGHRAQQLANDCVTSPRLRRSLCFGMSACAKARSSPTARSRSCPSETTFERRRQPLDHHDEGERRCRRPTRCHLRSGRRRGRPPSPLARVGHR